MAAHCVSSSVSHAHFILSSMATAPLTFSGTSALPLQALPMLELERRLVGADQARSAGAGPSSVSRTLRARTSGVNGFCRNGVPSSRTPCRTTASSAYPDM